MLSSVMLCNGSRGWDAGDVMSDFHFSRMRGECEDRFLWTKHHGLAWQAPSWKHSIGNRRKPRCDGKFSKLGLGPRESLFGPTRFNEITPFNLVPNPCSLGLLLFNRIIPGGTIPSNCAEHLRAKGRPMFWLFQTQEPAARAVPIPQPHCQLSRTPNHHF